MSTELNGTGKAHEASRMISDALGALRRKLKKNGYDITTFKANTELIVGSLTLTNSLSWPDAKKPEQEG